MNPYTDIQVTPLYSRDGMRSQGKSVRLADENETSGWRELGVVSQNYLLVHNTRVKDVVDTIAEKSAITDWQLRKQFFDGKRFVYSVTTDSITAEVAPGDLVRFGLIAYNSYDGTRALSLSAYAEHLVCSNGMTSEMHFARFTFRHNQGNINWDDQTQAAFSAVLPGSRQRLERFAQSLRTLSSNDLSTGDIAHLRQDYLHDITPSAWGKIIDKYLTDKKYTAFGLLDACTGNFWHNEKPTYSDYRNTSYATDSFLKYANAL